MSDNLEDRKYTLDKLCRRMTGHYRDYDFASMCGYGSPHVAASMAVAARSDTRLGDAHTADLFLKEAGIPNYEVRAMGGGKIRAAQRIANLVALVAMVKIADRIGFELTGPKVENMLRISRPTRIGYIRELVERGVIETKTITRIQKPRRRVVVLSPGSKKYVPGKSL